MQTVDYFTVVGVSPRACVNSLCSFLERFPDVSIRNLSFIVSLTEKGEPSQRSIDNVESIVRSLADSSYASNLTTPLRPDYIWIPEADLGVATRRIINDVLSRITDCPRVVVDATAGRKIMASSAVVASLLLAHLHGIPVDINYYLLKTYSDDTKRKEYSALGDDDAQTLIFNAKQLLRDSGFKVTEVNDTTLLH